MKFVHANEHFTNVESRDILLEHTRVVEKGTEVASRNVFHGEIDVLRVLERI